MRRVGRRRQTNLKLPAGVREIAGRWYWQPTSKKERDERREKGDPLCVTLGDAGTRVAREKWAEVSGYRDAGAVGTMDELFSLWRRDGLTRTPQNKPRSPNTVRQYRSALNALEAQFGSCSYGKTEADAAIGKALGPANIQKWVFDGGRPMENTSLAVLSNVFEQAIRAGRTTYNPCLSVVTNAQDARTREPAEWEVECLRTLAEPLLGLMMDFEAICGWRVMDIARLQRIQLTADGVKVKHGKRGKRRLWEWTPELRRIIGEADNLPGATTFPASPVFPTRRGKPYSYSGAYRAWCSLIERTNAMLAACEIPLRIEDLHFHDLRSKAHDDAEDAGREGHELLGNTERVSREHYARREQKVRPLR